MNQLRRIPLALASAIAAGSLLASPVAAQSLFRPRPAPPQPHPDDRALPGIAPAGATPPAGTAPPAESNAAEPPAAHGEYSLRSWSMYAVERPAPRAFQVNDLVTIIIDETSNQSADQSVETKTDFDQRIKLNKFPSVSALKELQFITGDRIPIVESDITDKEKYKGEGKYSRSDRFRAKITARITDVKPNGTLVLEARKTITKDEEITSMLLSGSCRTQDVTNANTVLSSQLADLTLESQNDGDVADGAEKGWITKFFETVFNF